MDDACVSVRLTVLALELSAAFAGTSRYLGKRLGYLRMHPTNTGLTSNHVQRSGRSSFHVETGHVVGETYWQRITTIFVPSRVSAKGD